MLLSLAACLFITEDRHAERLDELAGPTSTATTETGTTPPGQPTLGAVSPPYGTDAGGTEVTLTGSDFGAAPVVQFGARTADVLSAADGEIVVHSPQSAVPTGEPNLPVVVSVTTDGGTARITGAFTYWPDATGQVGATGELVWFRIVGGYWSTIQPDYGRATLRFTQGFDYQFYRNWAPDLDTCVVITDGVPEYTYDPVFETIDALSGTATESSPSSTIDLTWNAAEARFVHYDLLPEDFSQGETYDLTLTDTVGVPAVSLPGVFSVPSNFVVEEPDITGNTLPPISRDQHFGWSTDETGDAFLIQVGMLTADQSAFDQELWCVARDVGSFDLPGALWTRWAPDRFVNILVGRYRSGTGLLPWNQGRIGTASQLWYYGAAKSQ